MVLSIVEARPRHGYEIGKLIETISGGQLKFHVASLYPLLYRLEERGWLQGRWVEKPGQRRRGFYTLTKEGHCALVHQRDTWKSFVQAMSGLIAAVALTGVLDNMLFRVPAIDAMTFMVMSGIVVGVAVLASYMPARRASSVDPLVSLRTE
jgi:PadR family transcriptional regulator, regulatory protein PadR